MTSARSTAIAGLLFLLLVMPAAAQTTGPADSGAQRNDQAARTDTTPPAVKEMRPPAEPRAGPPPHADDGFELPPPAGCRYRENKLDLIV